MTQVYVAGKWEARPRLRESRAGLRALGFSVVSSWLDRPDSQDYAVEDGVVEAPRDLAEIKACDLFILDTLDENKTGGANVEFGYALAIERPALWIVGPKRNVFHTLASRQFETWKELLEWGKPPSLYASS